MSRLPSESDAASPAQALGISREATALYASCDVIDLHLDSFIWHRAFGYDLTKRHAGNGLGGRLFGHADFPRARQALSGATWVITTQPWRTEAGRRRAFEANHAALCGLLDAAPGFARVGTVAQYREARARGQHAAFVGVQGGNALSSAFDLLPRLAARDLLRVTLVHGTVSSLGVPSNAWRARRRGLKPRGLALVEALNDARIFVDLAHVSERGFWDALDAHDPHLPPIVTHTGAAGVTPLWRNLDDAQLRAIAERGGVIGVILNGYYLGAPFLAGGSLDDVVDHVQHVIRVAGEDAVALGSDFDGLIIPPAECRSVSALPRLAEAMLRRGMPERQIRKFFGENFLASLERLRGPD